MFATIRLMFRLPRNCSRQWASLPFIAAGLFDAAPTYAPNFVRRCLARRRIERHLAQPQGDDPICQREDLLQAMADQDHRYVLRRDLLDQPTGRLGLTQS